MTHQTVKKPMRKRTLEAFWGMCQNKGTFLAVDMLLVSFRTRLARNDSNSFDHAPVDETLLRVKLELCEESFVLTNVQLLQIVMPSESTSDS